MKTATVSHGVVQYVDENDIPHTAYRGDIVTMPDSEYERLAKFDAFGDPRESEIERRVRLGLPSDPNSVQPADGSQPLIGRPLAGDNAQARARMEALRAAAPPPADDIEDLSETVNPAAAQPAYQPFEDVTEPAPATVERPIHVAPKADWVNYAVNGAPEALRLTKEDAEGMTKAELIGRFR